MVKVTPVSLSCSIFFLNYLISVHIYHVFFYLFLLETRSPSPPMSTSPVSKCFCPSIMIVDLVFVKRLTSVFLLSPFVSKLTLPLLDDSIPPAFYYNINLPFLPSLSYFLLFTTPPFLVDSTGFLPSLSHFSLPFWNLRRLSQSVPPVFSYNYSNHFLLVVTTLYSFSCFSATLSSSFIYRCTWLGCTLIRLPVV